MSNRNRTLDLEYSTSKDPGGLFIAKVEGACVRTPDGNIFGMIEPRLQGNGETEKAAFEDLKNQLDAWHVNRDYGYSLFHTNPGFQADRF